MHRRSDQATGAPRSLRGRTASGTRDPTARGHGHRSLASSRLRFRVAPSARALDLPRISLRRRRPRASEALPGVARHRSPGPTRWVPGSRPMGPRVATNGSPHARRWVPAREEWVPASRDVGPGVGRDRSPGQRTPSRRWGAMGPRVRGDPSPPGARRASRAVDRWRTARTDRTAGARVRHVACDLRIRAASARRTGWRSRIMAG